MTFLSDLQAIRITWTLRMKKSKAIKDRIVCIDAHDLRPSTAKDLKRLRDIPENHVDTSDISEADAAWFRRARQARLARLASPGKQRITILVDKDVLGEFRAGGPGYQTRMNIALRQAAFGEPTTLARSINSTLKEVVSSVVKLDRKVGTLIGSGPVKNAARTQSPVGRKRSRSRKTG